MLWAVSNQSKGGLATHNYKMYKKTDFRVGDVVEPTSWHGGLVKPGRLFILVDKWCPDDKIGTAHWNAILPEEPDDPQYWRINDSVMKLVCRLPMIKMKGERNGKQ